MELLREQLAALQAQDRSRRILTWCMVGVAGVAVVALLRGRYLWCVSLTLATSRKQRAEDPLCWRL